MMKKRIILLILLLSIFMSGVASASSDIDDKVSNDVINDKISHTNNVDKTSISTNTLSKNEETTRSISLNKNNTKKKILNKQKSSSSNEMASEDENQKIGEPYGGNTISSADDDNKELISTENNKDTNETMESPLGKSNKQLLISSAKSKSFADIQKMVDNAKAGGTISLSGTYIGKGTHIKITNPITVEGNGATLDAKGLSKILEITAANVKINNINFKNGKSSCAGAIDWWSGQNSYHRASNGLLTNCNFVNCSADFLGGAVYFCDDSLSMYNCKFTNNTAYKGGAVYVSGKDCIIDSCKFYGNSLRVDPGNLIAALGAAICCEGDNNVIDNCILEGNDIKGTLAYNFDLFDGFKNVFGMGIAIIKNSKNPSRILISNTKFKNAITFYQFYGSEPETLYEFKYSSNIYCENQYYAALNTCSFNNELYGASGISKCHNVKLTKTVISVPNIIFKKGKSVKVVASIKTNKGQAVTQGKVLFNINGKYYLSKVKNGKATITLKLGSSKKVINCIAKYVPTFSTTNFYASSKTKFKAMIMLTPKLIAKAKVFNKSVKIKKYNVALKDYLNKPLKQKSIILNVNNKKYVVKTNNKGVATFQIKNLNKKGKYTATITYKGDKNYNKVSKKVKISIK